MGRALAYAFGLRTAVITALVDDDIAEHSQPASRSGSGHVEDHLVQHEKRRVPFSTDQKGTLMNGINFTFNGKGVIPRTRFTTVPHPGERTPRRRRGLGYAVRQRGVRVFNTGGIYTLISPTSAGLAIQAVKKPMSSERS